MTVGETLRAAAAELDGTGLSEGSSVQPQLRMSLANELRNIARSLCDHPRILDGVCRYCDIRIEGSQISNGNTRVTIEEPGKSPQFVLLSKVEFRVTSGNQRVRRNSYSDEIMIPGAHSFELMGTLAIEPMPKDPNQ